jgi:rhomboid protease GluP
VASALFTILYTLAHYVFVLRLHWVDPPESAIDLLGPAVLAAVLGYFFVAPRSACLRIDQEKRRDVLTMFASMLAAAPGICAQHYVREATAERLRLPSPDDVTGTRPVRYYEFDRWQADLERCSVWKSQRVEGKNSDTLRFSISVACPLTALPAQIWVGRHYTSTISNRTSDQGEQARKRTAFDGEVFARFSEERFTRTQHFQRLGNTFERDELTLAATRVPNRAAPRERLVMMLAVDRPYAPYKGAALSWTIGFWLFLCLGWSSAVRLIGHQPRALANFVKPSRKKSWSETLSRRVIQPLGFLVPNRERWATSILIDANILVFLAMLAAGVDPLTPAPDVLVRWGGLAPELVKAGQWWRCLSYQFLHGGVIHLLVNMTMLGLAGYLLEFLVRQRACILFTYVLGGLAGAIAALPSASVTVGASGSIFALLGAQLGAFARPSARASLGYLGLVLAVPYFLLDLLTSPRQGIAWQAHAAGFVAGALIGLVLPYRTEDQRPPSSPRTTGPAKPK